MSKLATSKLTDLSKETQLKLKSLAKSMGVPIAQVLCLAKSVAISIDADGVDHSNIAAQDQIELTEAYIPHAVKKFDKFQTRLSTNSEASKLFKEQILIKLTKGSK